MSWLTGTSTWANLDYDLTRLICGEVADGQGNTNTTPWIREFTRTITDLATTSGSNQASAASFTAADAGSLVIASGVPANTTISSVSGTTATLSANATATASGVTAQIATNTIRTPATKDVASGSMSNRTGYFALLGAGTGMTSTPTALNSVCRVTGPYTTDPTSSGFHRWVVSIRVGTVNTVAGNYSSASLTYYVIDLDTGTTYVSSSTTPNAAGVATLPGGLQVTVSDPSGILTLNTAWARAFTSTYMYGVDPWPMLHRASANPTFSVAPPGVAGTDYDVVQSAYGNTGFAQFAWDRGNLLHGLGIKTATGLGAGALYTVSFPMAFIKCRMFPGVNGVLSLDVGQSKKDAVNSVATNRAVGGYRITTWLKAWTTAASVTAASAVQYWLSVTSDGIVLALNADPAQTGKLGTAFLAAFTPIDPTYDVFPVAFNYTAIDYSVDNAGNDFIAGTQYPYYSLRRRQDGSEGTRDWQTRWMRAEHLFGGQMYAGLSGTDIITVNANNTSVNAVTQLSAIGAGSNHAGGVGINVVTPGRQNKPGWDGKWWLYGFQYGEGSWQLATAQGNVDENRQVRGQQISRYLFLPGDGWGSGDELTDTATSTKYLLLTPDFAALPRARTAASTYNGGTAIAEL